jgi:hypothetical protein
MIVVRTQGVKARVVLLGVFVMFLAGGCTKKEGTKAPEGAAGGQPAAGTPATPATGVAELDPAKVENPASITGTVSFSGTAPPMQAVDMSAKPECVALHKDDKPAVQNLLVGKTNGLQDVFVYISAGLEKHKFATPKEAIALDQKGCMYVPHVFGMMVNQDLKMVNSDGFLHNVQNNDVGLNLAQNTKQEDIKQKVFKKKFFPTTFQCQVHPWMRAYACVVDHPYFAVTDADGKFTIKGLPAGKYKLKVWHEPYPGLKADADEQEVEVAAGETKTVTFTYKK